MPPTAGAMKIERGWMYYPTIYHGDFLLKNRHLGRRQPWPPPPPMGRPRSFRSMTRTDTPWATPPTTGAIKIEREWMYYPTIHHVYLVE